MSLQWTKEKIKGWLKKNRRFLAYQKIELPYGYTTYSGIEAPKDFRDKLTCLDWKSFKGKKVLDVGCNIGYFCFKAHRNGANSVVGVDGDLKKIKCANAIKEMWNYDNMRFESNRIEEMTGKEQFDIVLFLSVYHHLDNVFSPIKKLADLVKPKGILYFEVVCPKNIEHDQTFYLQKKYKKNDSGGKDVFRVAFYPTKKTVKWLLESCFDEVEYLGVSLEDREMARCIFAAKKN